MFAAVLNKVVFLCEFFAACGAGVFLQSRVDGGVSVKYNLDKSKKMKAQINN